MGLESHGGGGRVPLCGSCRRLPSDLCVRPLRASAAPLDNRSWTVCSGIDVARRSRSEGRAMIAYHLPQVMRLTGLSLKQLDYWDRCKYIQPSIASGGRGSGSSRLWSEIDVRTLIVVRLMLEAGFSIVRTVPYMATIREAVSAPIEDSSFLVVVGDEIMLVDSVEGMRRFVRDAQSLYSVIPLIGIDEVLAVAS